MNEGKLKQLDPAPLQTHVIYVETVIISLINRATIHKYVLLMV